MHPDDQHYTYFSYRFNCRSKGLGWRLDMCKSTGIPRCASAGLSCPWLPVVVSERIAEKVKLCEIRSEIYGASDHVPVVMEIERELVMGMS